MKKYAKFAMVNNKIAAASALFIYILLFIINAVPVCGQHYNFKTFTMDDGLGESVINTVYQDSKGFLWIGTFGGGVDRFDCVRRVDHLPDLRRVGKERNHVLPPLPP